MTELRDFQSFVDLLEWRAERHPDKIALRYFADGETQSASLSYGELLRQSRVLAAELQRNKLQGQRLLLLYPPGLDFLPAFLGCLYAGAIPVPAYPPEPHRLQHTLKRLQSIIVDASTPAVLTDSLILGQARELMQQAGQTGFDQLQWFETDTVIQTGLKAGTELNWQKPELGLEDICFLQYTSGSTAQPKGVVISHGNLLHNAAMFQVASGHQEQAAKLVCWVPVYHDMGLVGHLLNSLYIGGETLIMPPLAFLKKPLRWLKLISDYQATSTGAPNFAFDLCLRKISPAERDCLDLSSLKFALNAAEPIHASTIEKFIRYFAPSGLRADALAPAYGMAETTVFISTAKPEARPFLLSVDKQALAADRIVPVSDSEHSAECVKLVACGYPWLEGQLLIVQPEKPQVLSEDQVGEIWIQGPHVAQGYWNQPEASAETFQARLDGYEGVFLRTGDLGFLHAGQVYVTGRRKDLMIVRGRNLYPQDLERSIDALRAQSPVIRPGCGVAFSAQPADSEQSEQVILFQEVALPPEAQTEEHFAQIAQGIAAAVTSEHDIAIENVVLVKPGTLPKTSSGKLMRQACRQAWASGIQAGQNTGSIEVLYHWQAHPTLAASEQPVSAADWQRWLGSWLSRSLDLPSDKLDLDQRFQALGLDSVRSVQLVSDLEQAYGRSLPETLLWEYPSPRALLNWLSGPFQPDSAVEPQKLSHPNKHEPIAVIGMACRLPGGVDSPELFWELLAEGRDAIGPIPESRWPLEKWYAPKQPTPTPGKMYVREGGYLDAIDQFEPGFFQISPREALSLDPQQRLLLELAWEALENAGLDAKDLYQSQTGVFIGLSNVDYRDALHEDPERIDVYAGTGASPSVAAGRIAYWLGLQGPAMTLDTACSSSLVAVHQACQSLMLGESELAFAGGVNLILSPEGNLYFCQLQALAEDSRCKSFDASADGFIRSEGGGMVLLKRLSDAQRDGDQILGLICGSAVNHDGPSNGLTAPNGRAQQQVITRALQQAGVAPEELSFVETHGTGTPLGDPIEAQALQNVLLTPERSQPLYLGALKSNLGHLESAAGIAGLIKTLLLLQRRQIPANLHFQTLNPRINQHALLQIPTQTLPWPVDQALLAGVSSFGISGTNAHLVLAAAPESAQAAQAVTDQAQWPILITAHSEAALQARLEQFAGWLDQHPDVLLSDLAYTLQRRTHLAQRWAVYTDSLSGLRQRLDDALAAKHLPAPLNEPRPVFVFSGQGAQWPGMGRELLQTQAVFSEMISRCEAAFAPEVDWRLTDVLQTATEQDYSQIELIQPVIFAVQVALAALWQSWGIQPQAVIGHSMGEVAAAYVAGALSLTDAAKIICRRSRLLSQLSGQNQSSQGGMLFTALSPEACEAYLSPEMMIGVYNGPDSTVLTGERAALEALHRRLEAEQIFSRFVQVPVAAHSAQIDAFEASLKAALSDLQPQVPQLRMLSTVQVAQLTEAPDRDYWFANLREPVRFAQTVNQALEEGFNLFIEISPHPLLLQTLQASARHHSDKPILTLSSLKRAQPELNSLRQSLLQAVMAGLEPRWQSLTPAQGRLLNLPNYPWQRQAYWLKRSASPKPSSSAVAASDVTIPAEQPKLSPSTQPTKPAVAPEQTLYQLHWESSSTPSPQALSSGHWLVFSDHAVLNQSLSLLLKARGQQLIFIRSGHELELGQPPFAIDPLDPEHYTRLIQHLNRHLKLPVHGVIFAFQPEFQDFAPEQAEAAYTRLAHLLRSLEALQGPTPRLYLISRGAWEPDVQTLAQSVWWGLGRTAFYEYPQWHSTQIDLSPEPGPAELQLLVNELLAQSPESNLLLRGTERQVARLGAYRGADAPPPAPERSLLDKLLGRNLPVSWTPASKLQITADGIYLISGGLGELGLETAQWLVRQGAKKLALIGRQGAARAEQQQAVQVLQSAGVQIEILRVDVADQNALAQALSDVRKLGPIKGVIHAAGVLQDGLIVGQSVDALRDVLRPKVSGGWNLHTLTLSDALDFFVCYASITATLGMPGQSNYAAANSFLDALIQHRRKAGLPGLSINWGPWYRAERALLGGKRQMLSQYGFHWLDHPTGFKLLERLLRDGAAHASVMGLDLSLMLQALPQTRNLPLLSLIAREQNQTLQLSKPKSVLPAKRNKVSQSSSSHAEPEFIMRSGQIPPAEELERFLQQTIARILGVPPAEINTQTSLRIYGFDSLMALELKAQLQATYNITLMANERSQSMTISEMTEKILGAGE